MMIIYWKLCHFNAVAWMQITEPWNICSAFLWELHFQRIFCYLCHVFPCSVSLNFLTLAWKENLTVAVSLYFNTDYFVILHSFYKSVLLMAETLDFFFCNLFNWRLITLLYCSGFSIHSLLLLKSKNEHSYTLTMKDQKEELRKQSHLPLQQKE